MSVATHWQKNLRALLRRLAEHLLGVHVIRDQYLPRGIRLDRDIARYLPRFRAELVVDVGANVGQSAEQYLEWFVGTQIFCFEPVSDTFLQLRENMRKHRQVHCFRLALGESEDTGTMLQRGTSDLSFLARTPEESLQYDGGLKEQVSIQRLDSFCRNAGIKAINFLKVDTEGHDLAVLIGAGGMLDEQRIDIVQAEVSMHPGNTRQVSFESVKDYLQRKEYRLFAIYEQVPEWTERAPNLRRTNAVFISRQVIESNRN